MGRRRVTGANVAAALGKSQSYVSRRLTGETAFDTDDLETISGLLSVDPDELIAAARRLIGRSAAWAGQVVGVQGVAVRPADNRPGGRPGKDVPRPVIHRPARVPRVPVA